MIFFIKNQKHQGKIEKARFLLWPIFQHYIFSNVILFFNCDFLFFVGVFGFWWRKSNVFKMDFYLLGTSLGAFYSYLNDTYLTFHWVRFLLCSWAIFSQFSQMSYFCSTVIFYFLSVLLVLDEENQMCLKLTLTYWTQVSEHFIAILMIYI